MQQSRPQAWAAPSFHMMKLEPLHCHSVKHLSLLAKAGASLKMFLTTVFIPGFHLALVADNLCKSDIGKLFFMIIILDLAELQKGVKNTTKNSDKITRQQIFLKFLSTKTSFTVLIFLSRGSDAGQRLWKSDTIFLNRSNFIHPSIFYFRCSGSQGVIEPIAAVSRPRQGYMLDKWQV